MHVSEKRTGEPLTVVSVKVKGREAKVSLSSGDKLVLSVDSFTEFHLYQGKELGEAELRRINELSRQDQSYDLAIKWLSHDSYSSAEIQRKLLAKGFDPSIVKAVVARLTELGLLDDARFARTYAEDVGDLRLLGHNHIIYDLRVKGIDEEILRSLSFPKEKELDKAKRYASVLDRRYYRAPYAKRLLKINRALMERGFDEAVAHEAAKEMASAPNPEIERGELEKSFGLAHAKYAKKYSGYELSRHIYASLVRKGFGYEEVKAILEENGL